MTETNECTHGYEPHERRHCAFCMYSDELAEREAEIETLKTRIEQAPDNIDYLEDVLYDILEDDECALSTREIIEERTGIRG